MFTSCGVNTRGKRGLCNKWAEEGSSALPKRCPLGRIWRYAARAASKGFIKEPHERSFGDGVKMMSKCSRACSLWSLRPPPKRVDFRACCFRLQSALCILDSDARPYGSSDRPYLDVDMRTCCNTTPSDALQTESWTFLRRQHAD